MNVCEGLSYQGLTELNRVRRFLKKEINIEFFLGDEQKVIQMLKYASISESPDVIGSLKKFLGCLSPITRQKLDREFGVTDPESSVENTKQNKVRVYRGAISGDVPVKPEKNKNIRYYRGAVVS